MQLNKGEIMTKKKQPKIINSEILSRVDKFFTEFDRARRNSNYISEVVKQHLTWTTQIENTNQNDDSLTIPNFKGKLPHIYECMNNKFANYKNSIFKSADGMFNVESDIEAEGQASDFAQLQKANLVNILKKGRIVETYIDALVKQLWRGETILFHEWGTIKGKRQIVNGRTNDKNEPVDENGDIIIDKNGQPILDEDGESKKQKYDVEFEEYDQYNGVLVKSVEPTDFVFDVTKLNAFSSSNYDVTKFNDPSCVKIRRVWMSLSEIKSKWDITEEEEAELKQLSSSEPKVEQNFDDWSNRFGWRYSNGDMIEVLEWWGDLETAQQEKLKDYRIITAGSKVVLECEPSPYSRCPFVWMPDILDLTTRRGISSLVVGIDFNESATLMFNAQKKALKFALNPAYLVGKGMALTDANKEVTEGAWVQYDDGLGNGSSPIEIKSYQNIPLTYESQDKLKEFIQQGIGTSQNNMGAAENPTMTAQQSRDIVAGSSNRTTSDIMDYTNMVLLPSLEIIATLTAENTHIDKIEKVKVDNPFTGQEEIAQVDDAIRKGQYAYTIGSAQAILERKSQMQELIPVLQTLSNPAIQQTFDIKEMMTYIGETLGVQKADRFLNKGNPQVQQLQQQLQQQQQQMQMMQQQHEQEKQQLLQVPSVLQNKIKNDIVATTLSRLNTLPEDFIEFNMQSLGVQPTSEMAEARQKEVQQQQTKQMNQQIKQQKIQSGNVQAIV